MLTRCPRPYRDQLAIERRGARHRPGFRGGLDKELGLHRDVSSGRLVRDSRNRFDGVSFAGTG